MESNSEPLPHTATRGRLDVFTLVYGAKIRTVLHLPLIIFLVLFLFLLLVLELNVCMFCVWSTLDIFFFFQFTFINTVSALETAINDSLEKLRGERKEKSGGNLFPPAHPPLLTPPLRLIPKFGHQMRWCGRLCAAKTSKLWSYMTDGVSTSSLSVFQRLGVSGAPGTRTLPRWTWQTTCSISCPFQSFYKQKLAKTAPLSGPKLPRITRQRGQFINQLHFWSAPKKTATSESASHQDNSRKYASVQQLISTLGEEMSSNDNAK